MAFLALSAIVDLPEEAPAGFLEAANIVAQALGRVVGSALGPRIFTRDLDLVAVTNGDNKVSRLEFEQYKRKYLKLHPEADPSMRPSRTHITPNID